jgi:aspartate/tyrosine/aromatic aminotransferase
LLITTIVSFPCSCETAAFILEGLIPTSTGVLPSVKAAKKVINETPGLDHEYLPIHGSTPFLSLARDLILGDSTGSSSNVVSLQTISGTGANHLGALFLAKHLKPKRVFISDPTWNNHHLLWSIAAPNVVQKTYPYFSHATNSLDFDACSLY